MDKSLISLTPGCVDIDSTKSTICLLNDIKTYSEVSNNKSLVVERSYESNGSLSFTSRSGWYARRSQLKWRAWTRPKNVFNTLPAAPPMRLSVTNTLSLRVASVPSLFQCNERY